MRRLLLLALLLSVGAGCQNIRGPFQPPPEGRIDDPRLPISEQERRARDRWAQPVDSPAVGPSTQSAPSGLYPP
jgi:hypothetical protein